MHRKGPLGRSVLCEDLLLGWENCQKGVKVAVLCLCLGPVAK